MSNEIVRKPDGSLEVYPETLKQVFILLVLLGILGVFAMVMPLAMNGGRRHHGHMSATGIVLSVCLPLGAVLLAQLARALRGKPLVVITKEGMHPSGETLIPWSAIREVFVCSKRSWRASSSAYVIGLNLNVPPHKSRWTHFYDSWLSNLRDHADIAITLTLISRESLEELIEEIGQYQPVSDRIDDTMPGESFL